MVGQSYHHSIISLYYIIVNLYGGSNISAEVLINPNLFSHYPCTHHSSYPLNTKHGIMRE